VKNSLTKQECIDALGPSLRMPDRHTCKGNYELAFCLV